MCYISLFKIEQRYYNKTFLKPTPLVIRKNIEVKVVFSNLYFFPQFYMKYLPERESHSLGLFDAFMQSMVR